MRFTVEQYHRLGELGILSPEDKVELLEGWIVEKMDHVPLHGFLVGLMTELLQQQLPPGYCLRCQLPLTTDRSEPEPDLAIVQGVHQDFRLRHPSGSDCRLVVEVADTSLDKDRAKAQIYRTAGVREYWILNARDRCIERFQFGSAGDETTASIVSSESQLAVQFDRQTINIDLKTVFTDDWQQDY